MKQTVIRNTKKTSNTNRIHVTFIRKQQSPIHVTFMSYTCHIKRKRVIITVCIYMMKTSNNNDNTKTNVSEAGPNT